MIILKTLTALLLSPLIAAMSFVGYIPQDENSINTQIDKRFEQINGLGAYNPTGGGTYRLKNSLGTTNTSINLSSFKEPVSNLPYTMTYMNTSIAYGTINPGTSRSEFVSFTGITQNTDGSAQLTGVTRGLTRTPGGSSCTASSTLAQTHAGQSVFILSDSPCHFTEYAVKKNDETITGYWQAPNPVSAQGLATKSYVDGTAFGGVGLSSETATGTVELATRLELASSTQNGTLGRLVIPSSVATDTPSTYSTSTVVVTNPLGKINSGFLDLTTYTGQASTTQFTASQRATLASTSIATSSVTMFRNVQKVFASTTDINLGTKNSETVLYGISMPYYNLVGGILKIRLTFDAFSNPGSCTNLNGMFFKVALNSPASTTQIVASTTVNDFNDGFPADQNAYAEWTIFEDSGTSLEGRFNFASSTGGFYREHTVSTFTKSMDTTQPLTLVISGWKGNQNTCVANISNAYAELIK